MYVAKPSPSDVVGGLVLAIGITRGRRECGGGALAPLGRARRVADNSAKNDDDDDDDDYENDDHDESSVRHIVTFYRRAPFITIIIRPVVVI